MSEHLPECEMPPQCHALKGFTSAHTIVDGCCERCGIACICPHLLACEKRASELAYNKGYEHGFTDAKTAASQAVRDIGYVEDWGNAIDRALTAIATVKDTRP